MSKTQLIKIKKFLENKVFWNQNDIYHLSLIYQLENECYKEEKLLKKAAKKYPNWDYLKKRLAWHSRPLFHRDPSKSKLVPRKPLHLPRNPKFIPKKETLENLCFVTASGSDQPYFNLSIELLESIKATRWYSNIPIKILDCGLNKKDKDFLIKKFNAEIKDPGWDIHPNLIKIKNFVRQYITKSIKNGWKGCTARPFIHKHFPGYEFYFWLDTDLWVQDERALDVLVALAEQYNIGLTLESPKYSTWDKHPFFKILTEDLKKKLSNKSAFINNAYCITKTLNIKYAELTQTLIEEKKQYNWGDDLIGLNILVHNKTNFTPLQKSYLNYNHHSAFGLPIWDKQRLISPQNNHIIGLMSLGGIYKHFPTLVPLSYKKTPQIFINRIIVLFIILALQIKKVLNINKILSKFKNCNLQSIHYRTWPWENKKIKKEKNL